MYNMFEEYKNEQEIIEKFAKGDIHPMIFKKYCNESNKLYTYIDLLYSNIENNENNDVLGVCFNSKLYKSYSEYLKYYFKCPYWFMISNVYYLIYKLANYYDVSIEECDTWDKESELVHNSIPDFICGDGNTIIYIVENIISILPKDLPNAKRVKMCKEEIKKAFHIEGNKYPHWIQSSEWPLSKTGKPTKYLRTENKHGGEVKAYIFLDVDTNEEIVVEQCY